MRALVCTFLLFASAGLVQAGTIFTKPLDNGAAGINSNMTASGKGQCADEFRLAEDAFLGGAAWYGFQDSGLDTSTFRIRIFLFDPNAIAEMDSLGAPEAEPFFDVAVGPLTGKDTGETNPDGAHILRYSTTFSSVELAGGVEYWLMIASTTTTESDWGWSHSAPVDSPNTSFARYGDDGGWRNLRDIGIPDSRLDQAFELFASETVVPLPLATPLSLGLLVGIALLRRARKH